MTQYDFAAMCHICRVNVLSIMLVVSGVGCAVLRGLGGKPEFVWTLFGLTLVLFVNLLWQHWKFVKKWPQPMTRGQANDR